MSFELITPPAAEPLDAATARTWAKVSSSWDTIIGAILIPSARSLAEHITQRSLITQRWKMRLDRWPAAEDVRLWHGKAQEIVSITYVDAAGDTQTLNSALYTLDQHVDPGYVIQAYGTTWPDVLLAANVIEVTFDAGYGDAATDVPAPIRHWMLLKITAALENPASLDATGKLACLPDRAVDELLDPYVIHKDA